MHYKALLPICQEVSKPLQQVALYSITFQFEEQASIRPFGTGIRCADHLTYKSLVLCCKTKL